MPPWDFMRFCVVLIQSSSNALQGQFSWLWGGVPRMNYDGSHSLRKKSCSDRTSCFLFQRPCKKVVKMCYIFHSLASLLLFRSRSLLQEAVVVIRWWFCLGAARIIKNWKLLVAELKEKFPRVIIYFPHTNVESGYVFVDPQTFLDLYG